MSKLKRILSMICGTVLLLGLCPAVLAVGNTTSKGQEAVYSEQNHDYDTSVMTFNILADNSGTAKYDTPAKRVDRIAGLIQNYNPDVVNIQEAASTYYVDAQQTLSWHDALVQKLKPLGYDYVSFKSITGYEQSIQRGLLIFYKSDRFSFDSNVQQSSWGSLDAEATYNGVTAGHPYNRAYIYVELLDKQHGNMPVWFFNTHFAIDATKDKTGAAITDVATAEKISADIRTQQSVMFANVVKEKAGNAPFFAAGDYNIGLKSSYQDTYFTKPVEEQYRQLLAMTDTFAAMKPAALVAKRTLNTDLYCQNTGRVWAGIDHIYINDALQVVTDYHTLSDLIDGRRPSDHMPRIAYCSYRPAVTANIGTYDKWSGSYTHTVDNGSLNLTFTPSNANVTFTLADQAVGNNTLELTRYKNEFAIRFYNQEKLYDTVSATIYNTAATKPTLSATDAENVYFAKGAYHVVMDQNTTSLAPVVTGGTLYAEESCTNVSPTISTTEARKTYYVKADSGEVFHVYLYHETATAVADSKTVYIEDDTLGATGTVAFYDGEKTILGKAGTKIFGDYPEIVNLLRNGSVDTAIFAGGEYTGHDPENSFSALNKSVTLIGNNADVEANQRLDKSWSINPDRKEETVINGGIRIYQSAGSSYTYNITVKGMTFKGRGYYGCIYTEANDAKTANYDIQNNIFAGYGYYRTSASLWLNNDNPKGGIIKGNCFIPEGNQVLDENVNYDINAFYARRGIFARNLNGMTIENNRFVGFTEPLYLLGRSDNGAGYANYTVKNNRFELCDRLELTTQNITSVTSSAVVITGNEFLRCGNETGCGNAVGLSAIYLQFAEGGAGVDYTKCSLEITNNNFEECSKSVCVTRSANNNRALTMPVTITGNRFIVNDQHNQTDYLKKALDLNINLGGSDPTNWDLSYNYFASDYLLQGDQVTQTNNNYIVPDVHDPSLFINTNDKYTLSRSLYTPYYNDYALTDLTCDHIWDNEYTIDKHASCGEPGSKSIYCSICDAQKPDSVEQIPATGNHTTGDVIVDTHATCSATGVGHKDCTVCTNTVETGIVIPIDADAHKWETEYTVDTPATCGAAGSKSIHCEYCEAIKPESPVEIPATGNHTTGDVIVDTYATCSATGVGHKDCTVCTNTVETGIVIPIDADAHKWETDYTVDAEANCSNKGSKSIHCEYCDAVQDGSSVEIPTNDDHDDGEWRVVQEATTTTEGLKEKRCTRCDALLESKKIDKKAPAVNFTDVKKSDFFYNAVQWAISEGVTAGTSKTTFGPNEACTRAQAVTFLWRAAGSPAPKSSNNPFKDVKKSDYYYKAVLWAVENNITAGTSKTTFSPDEVCTRGQIVTFLWRANGGDKVKASNPFTDVKKSDYYYNAVLWAVKNGVTAGATKTTFAPNDNCTRGQIVTFLYRSIA